MSRIDVVTASGTSRSMKRANVSSQLFRKTIPFRDALRASVRLPGAGSGGSDPFASEAAVFLAAGSLAGIGQPETNLGTSSY